ncbi:MAG TPA: amidohydrolase family protein [Streptosporangiaceae bacterium]|jgi:aminocarboxymuconate-semialdehyde decarboxylase
MTDPAVPVIDVHSHYIPPAYWAAVGERMAAEPSFAALARANNLSPQPEDGPMRTLAGRISEMDEAGVSISVLSLPPPGAAIRYGDARLVSQINDELIAAAGQFPGRLRVLCALPLPDVPASLVELGRLAARDLVRGVAVTTNAQHWRLDDPALDAVYDRMCELGLPLLAHPALEPLPAAYADFALTATVSPVVSSTVGVLRMIYGGTFDRTGDLTVFVPHLGGTIPYLMQRLADLGRDSPARHPVPHYLERNLILDTCSYYPPAFRCALDTAGSGRLALGTDYPFRGTLARAVADVRSHRLAAAEQAAVLGGTAARWFG